MPYDHIQPVSDPPPRPRRQRVSGTDNLRGRWWKPDQPFQIVRGFLRRAPTAAWIPYDPWESFHALRGRYRTVSTLWGEFLELVRLCRQYGDALDRYTPTPQGEGLILDWITRYGLLGVLPASIERVVLPPTYETTPDLSTNAQEEGCWIVQRKHVRLAGHWITDTQNKEDASPTHPPWEPGDLVRNPDRTFEVPTTSGWQWELLNRTILSTQVWMGRFFMQKPPAAQYPKPLSVEFWATYQEPVQEWMCAAIAFAESVEWVSRYANLRRHRQTPSSQVETNANKGLWALNYLSALEIPYYGFGSKAIQGEWATASLLSVMARMFFLDLESGRCALRCSACDKIFVSNAVQAAYCSVTCRNNSSMRRYRKNLRLAAAAGEVDGTGKTQI